jgi:hypothetical protein
LQFLGRYSWKLFLLFLHKKNFFKVSSTMALSAMKRNHDCLWQLLLFSGWYWNVQN